MGRRVERKVSEHNGASWSVTDRRRFVYSDWVVVLELDASDPNDVTILRKYTWGLARAGARAVGSRGFHCCCSRVRSNRSGRSVMMASTPMRVR